MKPKENIGSIPQRYKKLSTAPDKLAPLAQHLRLEPPTAEALVERYRDETAPVREIFTRGMKTLEA